MTGERVTSSSIGKWARIKNKDETDAILECGEEKSWRISVTNCDQTVNCTGFTPELISLTFQGLETCKITPPNCEITTVPSNQPKSGSGFNLYVILIAAATSLTIY